jgi:DNA replication and repair protein RecF
VALSRVRIESLRCVERAELWLHRERSYIFGPNGAGKTSLLEGMFVLGRGRSFRTRQTRRLVRHGARGFSVYGEVGGPEGGDQRLGVAFEGGHLEKRLDGKDPGGMAALAAALPVHAIDPGSHGLVEGGPSERRRFIDWGVFHVEHAYLAEWKTYRRLLSQRNAALKAHAGLEEVRTWTAALLEAGVAVDGRRQAYVTRLAEAAERLGRRLLDRPLELEYRPGWSEGQSLEAALAGTEARDRAAGLTDVGPHRADLVVRLDDRRVQDEASRGQQKLAAAALVLAQVEVELADRPGRGLLLVDDPAAELDERAVARLMAALRELRVQLVLTGLTTAQLAPDPGFPVFHVERGEVRAL